MGKRGTLGTLLSIGATFDWITPTFATLQKFTHPPGQSFTVNIHDGADQWSLYRMFKRKGIPTWSYTLEPQSGDLSFYGHKRDTKKIERILKRKGLLRQ